MKARTVHIWSAAMQMCKNALPLVVLFNTKIIFLTDTAHFYVLTLHPERHALHRLFNPPVAVSVPPHDIPCYELVHRLFVFVSWRRYCLGAVKDILVYLVAEFLVEHENAVS